MTHEQTQMAFCKGFGGISSCSCGLYHIHLPGVSIRFNEENFDRLAQMILEAKTNKDLYSSLQSETKKGHLHLVKH
ncbi:hypothetical protein DRN98_09670 [Methanosarcinales archaeon]|nr:MAG: hypothetical protein DRN98_09670 [Methanosarcinales archaeon]